MVNVLESHGRNEARAYAVLDVPPPRPEPPVVAERVLVVEPRATATLRRGARAASGPRNAEQKVWPLPPPPAVDLPDGLPADKAQRVHLDPESVARWKAEAKAKEQA
jgi:hypothetical protein